MSKKNRLRQVLLLVCFLSILSLSFYVYSLDKGTSKIKRFVKKYNFVNLEEQIVANYTRTVFEVKEKNENVTGSTLKENKNEDSTGSKLKENKNEGITGSKLKEDTNENITGSKLKENKNEDITGSKLKENKNENNTSQSITRSQVACKVPVLDPFQKDAMRVFRMAKQKPQKCNIRKLSKLEGGTLTVDNKDGSIRSVTVEYIIRGRQRDANGKLSPPRGRTGILNDVEYKYSAVLNDDFHVHFGRPIEVNQNNYNRQFIMKPVEHDFLRVTITMNAGGRKIEHQSHISNKTETCQKNGRSMEKISKSKKGLPYNVHMILIDAQSRGNVYRQTKRLIKMIEDDEDMLIFKGHSVQGDGTCCQVMATLAGNTHTHIYHKTFNEKGAKSWPRLRYRGVAGPVYLGDSLLFQSLLVT